MAMQKGTAYLLGPAPLSRFETEQNLIKTLLNYSDKSNMSTYHHKECKILFLALCLWGLVGCSLELNIQDLTSKADTIISEGDLKLEVVAQPASVAYLGTEPVTINITGADGGDVSNLTFTPASSSCEVAASTTCISDLASGGTCNLNIDFHGASLSSALCEVTVSYSLKGQTKSQTISLNKTVTIPGVATVAKAYPVNGSYWNDYVMNVDTGKDIWSQPDTACSLAGIPLINAPKNYCIHGAEHLKVLTGQDSCTGLTLQEDLRAFNWKCLVKDGKAYFFSYGLKESKGLRSLITSSGWRSNRVKVYKNADLILESALTPWWNNTVQALPDNSAEAGRLLAADASGKGIIYYHDTDRTVRTYKIDSKSALVSLNSAKLLPAASITTDNSCYDTIFAPMEPPHSCIIMVNSKYFTWLEANLEYTSVIPKRAIFMWSAYFTRIENTQLNGNPNIAVDNDGLFIKSSWFGMVRNLNAAGFYAAVNLRSDVRKYIFDQVIAKSSTIGFASQAVIKSSVFRRLLLTNSSTGLDYSGTGEENVIQGISNLSTSNGTKLYGGYDDVEATPFMSFLAVNSGTNAANPALSLAASGTTLTNVAVTNSPYAIDVIDEQHKFSGVLILGNNTTNCSSIDSAYGLVSGTCADSYTDGVSTYTGSSSNAILRTNRDAINTFFGRLTTNEAANPLDTNSSISFASLLSSALNLFENPFRAWGKNAAAIFTPTTSQGRCSSETCRIYDWRLVDTDTVFRNTSGDGSAQNENFVAGATCPAAVHGNKVTVSLGTSYFSSQTYLNNAWEIMNDGVGDEDGLCESNESCVYTPNVGAYQGEGELSTEPCLFQNGVVQDVQIYAYPTNGLTVGG